VAEKVSFNEHIRKVFALKRNFFLGGLLAIPKMIFRYKKHKYTDTTIYFRFYCFLF